jgi:hypothetical protein
MVRKNAFLRQIAVRANGRFENFRDRNLDEDARRERRLQDELKFWEDGLARGEFGDLRDPETSVRDKCIVKALEEIDAVDISILDVGAGPLTAVGHRYPGKQLTITATDLLADSYMGIMDRLGVVPPVRTVQLAGEDLLTRWEPNSFDITCSQNALDHSADPWVILQQMLTLSRSHVALRHFRNEGEHNGYIGLHGWNIDVQDDKVWFWNPETRLNVSEAVAKLGWTETHWFEEDKWGSHVLVLLKRVATDH